jgi:hypothetical protein
MAEIKKMGIKAKKRPKKPKKALKKDLIAERKIDSCGISIKKSLWFFF